MPVKIHTFSTMDVSRKNTSRTLLSTASLVLALLFTISACNACQPTVDEITESKLYRSQIVIQATVTTRDDAVVARVGRTLKGESADKEMNLTGFGSEDPCFWETTDLSESSEYILFLDEMNQDGFYPIVANPVEATNGERKKIRKFLRDGAAPTFAKELKDKTYAQGGRATMSCVASGFPSPRLSMTKDGVTLSKGAVRGISYKSGKGGIRLKFKRLQKSLHEGVYACMADNGVHPQIMTSATIEICALACEHGELNVKRCECQCETGWDGITCNIPLVQVSPSIQPCYLDCGEHGRVHSTECRCECDDNYYGETCDTQCDKNCGTHGTLDSDTCTCKCQEGYFGDSCSNTADQMCNAGGYCQNGGTCYEVDDPKTRELIYLCRCAEGFVGDRCETPECSIDCGDHGTVDPTECRCVCEEDYRGTYCQSLVDDHTRPCGPEYKHYCMNGGECVLLVGIMKPSCRCPMLYYGNRCDRLEPDLDCGCLNGAECKYNETKQAYECICPQNFGGTRCQYVKPGYSGSSPLHRRSRRVKRYMLSDPQENSRKMAITMCVIFVAMLIVVGLVIVVYIRNRNAREKERREKLEQIIRNRRNGMRLRGSVQSTGPGAGGSYPADDIEMTSFPSGANQQPVVNVEHERAGARKSSDSPQGRGSVSRSNNGSVSGVPAKSSQASIHSSHSQEEREDSPRGRGGKEGYQAVPTQEQTGDPDAAEAQPKNNSDTSLEGPGDPDTLPLKRPRASSDLGSESEESEGEGDIIDVPNPQIQAIQNHLAGSDHDSGDYTWDEHSSPGLRITPVYPHDTSPLHQPRGRGRLNGVGGGRSPDRVNIHENPLENPGSKTDAMNNVMPSPKDAFYADRLKDVVEGSPPSAV